MTKELVYIKGEEFISKIINGERDFKNIKLQELFDFENSERIEEFRLYLDELQAGISLSKRNDNLDLSFSELHNIKAENLQFDYIIAMGTSFMGSYLDALDMTECIFDNSNFENTILWHVDFSGSGMKYVSLRNAVVPYSNFEYVDLTGADLRGIQRINEAVGLEKAIFVNTKVTKKEKAIIEEILSKTNKFEVLE